MKNLLSTALLAAALSACASTPVETYTVAPGKDLSAFQRDTDQCNFETSQQHRLRDFQQPARSAQCMLDKGYKLAGK